MIHEKGSKRILESKLQVPLNIESSFLGHVCGLPPGSQPNRQRIQRLRSLRDIGSHMSGSMPRLVRQALRSVVPRRDLYVSNH